MKQKSALVLGATGLVGQELVYQLLRSKDYCNVTCLIRKPLGQKDFYDPLNKLQAIVVDFEQLQNYQGYFTVDHVYCCLGTTLKQAGSKQAFKRVDFELIHVAAQLARGQRAKGFVWISSVGANAKSNNFYLRVKGELENAILTMPQLNHAAAVRPSLLLGKRKNKRPLEDIGQTLAPLIRPLMYGPLKKYRPVKAQEVARQMIELQPKGS